jgi:hypothetical protein
MELHEREAIIETCQQSIEQSWVEIGRQLRSIRDDRLYKETHNSFEIYCHQRWGFSRDKADQLINSLGVVENLEKTTTIVGIPQTHVRPLASLPIEHQEVAWRRAVETAPEGHMTERHVRHTINEMFHELGQEDESDQWDDRLSDAVKSALFLAEIDPDLVSTWTFERRHEWFKDLDAAIHALSIVRNMTTKPITPRLINKEVANGHAN